MIRKLILGIVLITLLACERDDLCAQATPTTPLLILRFYDADNPGETKPVTNLKITEVSQTDSLGIFNTDSIAIPLRTGDTSSTFEFLLNANSDDPQNPENLDMISFSYETMEEYINRACGFRVTYDGLDPQESPGDDGFWIDNINVLNATIVNETSAHINIFH